MNVLIADDNRDAAESLGIWLRMEGHEVRVVHDGEAAIAAFDAGPAEVAILDIGMPGLNGYQVAQRIRRDSPERPVTLIAVTGWGADDDKARAMEAGFDHHFTRPIEPDRLAELLRAGFADETLRPQGGSATRPGVTRGRAVKDPLSPKLLSELCHDLRGPLGALSNWIPVLQSERADHETRIRALGAMASGVRDMAALIDQVSTLAEALTGLPNISRQALDLVPFVRSACAAASENVPELALHTDEASLFAVADAVCLRQIVDLLASVAMDPARGDSRALRVARRGHNAELSVEMSGTPKSLIVPLARALAEAQGAALEEFLEGGTTTLRVLLPLAP